MGHIADEAKGELAKADPATRCGRSLQGTIPRAMSLIPGARVGYYEVLSVLGAGGMGEVYRARDTKLNREVAIKVLPDVGRHG